MNSVAHGPGWLSCYDAAIVANPIVARGHDVLVVIDIQQPAKLELPEIVPTGGVLCFGLGLGERGQQHPCQDGDDGDDDEQFDERESESRLQSLVLF